jgi:hypothetical protein
MMLSVNKGFDVGGVTLQFTVYRFSVHSSGFKVLEFEVPDSKIQDSTFDTCLPER